MRYLYLIPALLFFVSCGGDDESQTDPEQDITVSDSIPEYPDSLFTEMVDTLENEVFLEEIPSRWIMLSDETGTGEPLVIHNWCDSGVPEFEFTAEKGEAWNITLVYGQDGEQCEVTFFEAFLEEQELMEVVTGTFRYKGVYDESVRFCDFWWNKDTKVAHFEGMGMQSSWFVAAEDVNEFDTIDEDCEDFWE